MAKYKVGDKVRIVSERPASPRFVDLMVQYLGKTLTVSKVEEETLGAIYRFKEATYPARFFRIVGNDAWAFCEDWIDGLVEPKEPEFSVSVRFHGRLTVAELVKDGKVVKVKNARCNPKDKYSMAEGARIAVERLFEKKQQYSSDKYPNAFGKKFKVIGNSSDMPHFFKIGTVVKVAGVSEYGNYFCEALSYSPDAHSQFVSPKDLAPYKEA